MTRSSMPQADHSACGLATGKRIELFSWMIRICASTIDKSNEYVLYYPSTVLMENHDPQSRRRSPENIPRHCRRWQFHPCRRGSEQDPVGGLHANEAT